MAQNRGRQPRGESGTERRTVQAPETPLIPIAQPSQSAASGRNGRGGAPGKNAPRTSPAPRRKHAGGQKKNKKERARRTAPEAPRQNAAGRQNPSRNNPPQRSGDTAPSRPAAPGRAASAPRARTISYGEALRRRKRRKLAAGVLITVLLLVGLAVSFQVLYQVHTISIAGETPYTAEQILKVLPFSEGDNLLSVRDAETQQVLTSQLPYIESVKIVRRLPDSVEIQLTPAQEKYYINSLSGWVVLSESFKILRVTMEQQSGLVLIDGAEADNPVQGEQAVLTDADKQEALSDLLASLENTGFPDVSRIDVTSVYEMAVQYGNVRVLVGTVNELDEKLDWAEYLLVDMQVQGEQSGTLDVSTRNSEGRLTGHWLPD